MAAATKVIPLALPAQAVARKTNRSTMVFLSPDEVLAVLKASRVHSIRDWAMILLAYRHGLRASEVCGLKLADIDLKAGSVSIRRLKGSLSQVQPLRAVIDSAETTGGNLTVVDRGAVLELERLVEEDINQDIWIFRSSIAG